MHNHYRSPHSVSLAPLAPLAPSPETIPAFSKEDLVVISQRNGSVLVTAKNCLTAEGYTCYINYNEFKIGDVGFDALHVEANNYNVSGMELPTSISVSCLRSEIAQKNTGGTITVESYNFTEINNYLFGIAKAKEELVGDSNYELLSRGLFTSNDCATAFQSILNTVKQPIGANLSYSIFKFTLISQEVEILLETQEQKNHEFIAHDINNMYAVDLIYNLLLAENIEGVNVELLDGNTKISLSGSISALTTILLPLDFLAYFVYQFIVSTKDASGNIAVSTVPMVELLQQLFNRSKAFAELNKATFFSPFEGSTYVSNFKDVIDQLTEQFIHGVKTYGQDTYGTLVIGIADNTARTQ